MRFGKKLALQVMDDSTGAPYVSHKSMKEAINRTVRELRLYQGHLQNTERVEQDAAAEALPPDAPAELAEMEGRIVASDCQLFAIVDEDLARIHAHLRKQEARLAKDLSALQESLLHAGLLMHEAQLQLLEKALSIRMEDKSELCRSVLEFRIRGDPDTAFRAQQALASAFNALASAANEHTQYMEINVAGFRKLLKRHEKQIPERFRSRPSPCLRFHRLVTRRSGMLLSQIRQAREILLAARQIFGQAAHADAGIAAFLREAAEWPELSDLKGFGPECEMVLSIQKQLQEPSQPQLFQRPSHDVYAKAPEAGLQQPKLQEPAWLWAAAGGGALPETAAEEGDASMPMTPVWSAAR